MYTKQEEQDESVQSDANPGKKMHNKYYTVIPRKKNKTNQLPTLRHQARRKAPRIA